MITKKQQDLSGMKSGQQEIRVELREQIQLYRDFLRKIVDVTDNNKFGLIKIMADKLLKTQNEY